MNKCILLTLIIFFSFTSSYAQYFDLKGLEIYNPVYTNPAFTASDKFIQTDLLAYDFKINNGYWVNVMSTLPNSRSSFGLSMEGSKHYRSYSSFERDRSEENILYRSNRFRFSYAYTHNFTDKLKLSGGLSYVHSVLNVSDTIINLISRNAGFINTGLKLSYHKLYAGLSVGMGLYARNKEFNEGNTIEVSWDKMNSFSSSFIAGYSLGGERRVNFDPVIGYSFVKDLDADYSDFGFYAGGNITILKTLGLGFTVGDMFSVSTSLSVLDRVSLMLGIYQSEGDNHLSGYNYTLEFDPISFIAQLRIKI